MTDQSQKNGVDIPGATESTYEIRFVEEEDVGFYRCVVSGACKPPATSDEAVLVVNTQPTIIQHPTGDTVCEGQTALFTVIAGGTEPLSYQWRKDGVDILGATSDTYTIDAVTPADAGDYVVVVTNDCGSQPINAATLTVLPLQECEPIPTVSEWGLIVMALLLLTGGTIILQRRREAGERG